MTRKYLIIGDGIAGASAAEKLRDGNSDSSITILTDESDPLYNRITLKSYMKGKMPLKFTRIHDKDWYEEKDIGLKLNSKVVDVDRSSKTVETSNGEVYKYDKLLVASGGSPKTLSCDEGYENVHYMWTLPDAKKIKQAAEESEKAVVIGGGLLGIDFAVVFAENGAEVDYLIRGDNWWRQGLDEEGAEIIHRKLEQKGVNIITNTEVEDFEAEDNKVGAAISTDGRKFDCDTVAVAIGQTPNSDFIDVDKNDSGMIKTDRYLQTSDPDIYAAGNMVEYYSPVFERRIVNGSWDNSEAMGETAALNMLGNQQEFNFVNTYGVGHFDIPFLSIGDCNGKAVTEKSNDNGYKRLFYRKDRLVGAVLIGDVGEQEDIKRIITEKGLLRTRKSY